MKSSDLGYEQLDKIKREAAKAADYFQRVRARMEERGFEKWDLVFIRTGAAAEALQDLADALHYAEDESLKRFSKQ